MKKTTIHLNNSGGYDWLTEGHLAALADRGWAIETFEITRLLPEVEAMAEFESLTGYTGNERGCDCCGSPFYSYEEDVTPADALTEALTAPVSDLDEQAESWLRLIGEPI